MDLRRPVDLRRPAAAPEEREPDDPLAAAVTGEGPALLAVDGNGLVHRAFHGYAEDPRGPLHGFMALLVGLVDQTAPEGIVVGFDCGTRSRRREAWPDYKAHRPPHDPGVGRLLASAARLLEACGVTVARPEGLEADDVVASAATAAEAAGWRALVASSDRDVYATVSDRTVVLDWRRGIRRLEPITPARLRRDPGVRPEQYVELAALRGDPSDNLPGVEGIGASKAAALLAAYPTVEDAGADPIGARSVLGRRAGRALLADLDRGESSIYRRNARLMALDRTVPVDPAACRREASAEDVASACEVAEVPTIASRAAVALGQG